MYDYGTFSFDSKAQVLDRAKTFWNPGDTVLDRRRCRSGDRPPRGLLPVGHERSTAYRHAPQRRHLQPRTSQPRSGPGDFRGHGILRHRQPSLPVGCADRTRAEARRIGACVDLKVAFGSGAARRSISRSRAPVMPPSAARSSRSSRPTTVTPAWRWPQGTIGSRRSFCPTNPTTSSRFRSATSARWSKRSPAGTWPL